MPVRRDKEKDKRETRRLILDPNRLAYAGGVNWLGHGARGGKDAVIDELLLDGATMEQLLEERGTEASVRSHFNSLRTLHDLPVVRGADGKHRFDRQHLGLPDVLAATSAAPAEATRVLGTVRGTGNRYALDGVEAVEIWVPLADADGLPFDPNGSIDVGLLIDGDRYDSTLRVAAGKAPYVWISSSLRAGDGAKSRLSDVLGKAGVAKNQRVELIVTGTEIVVRPAGTDLRGAVVPDSGQGQQQTTVASLAAEEALPGSGGDDEFELHDGDQRPLIERQIRERRGQAAFRNALRARYGDRCLVSGCPVLAVLEAAHIRPYRGDGDNHPANGLILRADLHTLFDLDLLGIEPDTLRVRLHPGVAAEYGDLEGRKLRCEGPSRPSSEALRGRFESFLIRLGRADE
ncbi:HNH endonuclease [Limnoglobus roseus]|uniref:HNH endonuclease n=1 Tax=Limnoglobus roseus TaxID=2598579 RepID=A0A5C1AI83_9BACT|nr:HNH endonuclease [Limnoglobus roseus]QEL17382.1 HNH endonuclease [Limnoglobus roseus]